MDEIRAQLLLMKCTGDQIWSIEICQQYGLPDSWINELQETYESGFDTDRNTIYVGNRVTNQFRGVLDLHVAYKLSEFLGVDWKTATEHALGRRAEVLALQQAYEES